jgi:hypothetical protein
LNAARARSAITTLAGPGLSAWIPDARGITDPDADGHRSQQGAMDGVPECLLARTTGRATPENPTPGSTAAPPIRRPLAEARSHVRVSAEPGAPPHPPVTCMTGSSPSNSPSPTLSIRGQRSSCVDLSPANTMAGRLWIHAPERVAFLSTRWRRLLGTVGRQAATTPRTIAEPPSFSLRSITWVRPDPYRNDPSSPER